MPSNRLAFAALGIACIAAAGVGGYVATRQSAAGVPGVAVPEAASQAPAQPVLETEAPRATTQASAQVVAPVAAPTPMRSASRTPESRVTEKQQQRPTQPALPAPQAEGTIARSVEQPAPERISPNGVPTTPAPTSSPDDPADVPPLVAPIEEPPADVLRAPEPAVRAFQELVVSADSVIGLRTEGLLTSEHARVEDRVEARVVRDVRVNSEVAIPAGTRALGSVVTVERGGRVRDRARLGIRFQTLVLSDGTRMPISTETIYRYGDSPSNGSAAKIGGGAVAGAILGAIIGGAKGAAIGATTGAGAGTAAVVGGERSAAVFPPGSDVTARILSPVTVTVERE